jgi:rod shape-determining protein MreC
MAPRSDRRPGFSRRRQYGVFIAQIVAIAGALVALVLVGASRFDPEGFKLVRGSAVDATAPVARAFGGAANGLERVGAAAGDYVLAGRQNAQLRAELAAARRRLVAARALELENRRLRAVLRLAEPRRDRIAIGRLVGSSGSGPRRLAVLTAGRVDGVLPGLPVLAPEGLVGQTLEVGRNAARVMLLTDENNIVPVMLARDGMPAVATGSGSGAMEVKALGTGLAPFRRGDLLVTSGVGGLYPPGVPVAVVTKAAGDMARAWPIADPSRIDFVLVERSYTPPVPPQPALPVPR